MPYTSVCLLISSVFIPFWVIISSRTLSEDDPPQNLIKKFKRQFRYWKNQLPWGLRETGVSHLESIPRDLKLELVSYLDIQSAIRLTQVNHSWRLLILNNQKKTLKPIWLDTYAVPSLMAHHEAVDWRSSLKDRWDVITGRKFKPLLRKLEKYFQTFLVILFFGYIVPLLFIFHNLNADWKMIGKDDPTASLESSEAPSLLSVAACVILNICFGFCVAIVQLRKLRQDYRIYYIYDDDTEVEEVGWKLVHGDVYAVPENPDIMAAILGIGHGLIFTHGVLFIAQVPWLLWYKQPMIDLDLYLMLLVLITPTLNVLFATKHLNTLTNGISGSYWLVFLTQWLFSVPFLLLLEIVTRPTALMLFFINMNVRVILLVWFIGLLVSAVAGRLAFGKTRSWQPFVRTHQRRRPIPPYKYQQSTHVQAVIIAVIAASVFGYLTQFDLSWTFEPSAIMKSFPMIFSIAFSLQALTVVLLYAQLNRENYHWRWPCFFTGGCFPAVAFLIWLFINWHQLTLDEVILWVIVTTAFSTLFGVISFDGTDWWLSRMYRTIIID